MPTKIQLGIKGLAKYMTSSAATQRKILRDYKFPDEEGGAQAVYYREARDLIRAYHTGRHDQNWLLDKINGLDQSAAMLSGRSRSRLLNNTRTLRDYAKHFHKKPYDVLGSSRFSLEYSGVIISVTPDLVVAERGVKKMLKFDFAQSPPKSGLAKILTQGMYQAAVLNELEILSKDNLYVYVLSGEMHRGARASSRILRDIEATCATIASVWPTIQKDDAV